MPAPPPGVDVRLKAPCKDFRGGGSKTAAEGEIDALNPIALSSEGEAITQSGANRRAIRWMAAPTSGVRNSGSRSRIVGSR